MKCATVLTIKNKNGWEWQECWINRLEGYSDWARPPPPCSATCQTVYGRCPALQMMAAGASCQLWTASCSAASRTSGAASAACSCCSSLPSNQATAGRGGQGTNCWAR